MESTCQRGLAVFFLSVLWLWPCAVLTQGTAFKQQVSDFRLVKHEDLKRDIKSFEQRGIRAYTQLLFDEPHDQVIVGARNVLLRLSLRELEKLEEAWWKAPEETVNACLQKGQSEEDCHNYIKVLLASKNLIFACGTNAFLPNCTWREVEGISTVQNRMAGIAKCPYSPHANMTALFLDNGDYFIASPMDFSGQDHAIYRMMGTSNNLRTEQFNAKWLDQPNFVSSFERENFVYFAFRENAVEHMNCGKKVFSRIARVCKSDTGGQQLMKENWTTFLKARLNCSVPGDYPFYYDEIQGLHYVEELGLLYATFSTPQNGIGGSAVCAFSFKAVDAAFDGPFRVQQNTHSMWLREKESSPQVRAHLQCKARQSVSAVDIRKYQLMDNVVQPITPSPLYSEIMDRFTFIAVDIIPTKLHKTVSVLFVATADGVIKKLAVLPRTQETCLVEIIELFPRNHKVEIKSMKLLANTNSLYVGTDESFMRIPVQRCSRFRSRHACLNSMDPYCGWNNNLDKCTPPPNRNPLTSYWQQAITQCPVLTTPVDGVWSEWSDWTECAYQNEEPYGDKCACRKRKCTNPAPANGGRPCSGFSLEVANCTRHGGWTTWSAWSACSQTCGLAVKTRRRTCGNPEPAFGGRVCVGPDRDEIYCTSLPPCPARTLPPIDGHWSEWGEWDECSSPCGGGFRTRRRRCDNPSPQNGGQECIGCNIDYETCNTHTCPDIRKVSPWTPWLQVNLTADGSIHQKRFRLVCKANTVEASGLKFGQYKEDERFCRPDGSCMRAGIADGDDGYWSDWSDWSPCSADCGGGEQFRTRSCEGRPEQCRGQLLMKQPCNSHACIGEWSCWSDWSSCSVSCDHGVRQRTRTCLNPSNKKSLVISACDGTHVNKDSCQMPSCSSLEGWGTWSVWSECSASGQQFRKRKCLFDKPISSVCQGSDTEDRMCFDVVPAAVLPSVEHASSEGAVVGACLAAFAAGVLAAALAMYYYLKRQKPGRVPSNPHYISAKQNPYVSVPALSGKKVNSSAADNNTPKATPMAVFAKNDYETATIKRNSHVLINGQVQLDREQDPFF